MDDASDQDQDDVAAKKLDGEALRKRGQAILSRIKQSEKREANWQDEATKAEKAYTGDTKSDGDGKVYDFNILHSNVETIVPAIYNSTPVPDIRSRRIEASQPEPQQPQQPQQDPQNPQAQPDPQAIAQFQQQLAQYKQDAQAYAAKKQADADTKSYGAMLERAISLQIDDNRLDIEIEATAQDSFIAGRGVVRLRFTAKVEDTGEADEAITKISDENITFEAVSWRNYREGLATRWPNVPWVAYRNTVGDDQYERFVDKKLIEAQKAADKKDGIDDESEDTDVELWEFWDKETKEVLFVRADNGLVVKVVEDPMGLPGFFPSPQPIQPITVTGSRTPVCPFTIYKKLADELDTITKRIAKITAGMKVRGIMAGSAQSLIDISQADDNEIRIEPNLEQLVQTGGLDKAIAWWPIEKSAAVLAQLYAARDQVKSAIYEITGISDIVRGASNSGETATAQQIKTQWGSLRIQKMQRLVERQVRDIFVMMAHVVSAKFSPETLVQMTGVEITQGVQALMQSPIAANYRVNVESNSTISADLSSKKKEATEFLSGTAQFFSTVAPLVSANPEVAEPLSVIYSATSRLFKLGKEAEDALDRFIDLSKASAQKPRPNPQAEQAKADSEFKKQELQIKAQEVQGKQQLGKADLDIKLMQAKAKIDADGRITPEPAIEEHILLILQAMGEAQAKANAMVMQGLQQVMTIASAPRHTEIVVGADGKKSAISKPMVN